MLQAVTRLAIFGVAFLVASSLAFGQPNTGDPDAQRKADLVIAYKILVNEGILDSFGHVTVRSAKDPNIFFMPRAMPPSLWKTSWSSECLTANPSTPRGGRSTASVTFMARFTRRVRT